jgi:glutamate-1-semialdehyde 2,1-aminomutase/spore coat polysaccharide biosynthesis protein SpsF
MMEMEEIFFSGTFGGECLSIAASIAVIEKMQSEPVIASIWEKGTIFAKSVTDVIINNELTNLVSLNGSPPWKLLTFKDHPSASKELIRSVFIQEMLGHGVLLTASHNVCYAHDNENFSTALNAYDQALGFITERLASGNLANALTGPVIEPVFKVR